MTTEESRAVCAGCGEVRALREDGMIRQHGGRWTCPGSGIPGEQGTSLPGAVRRTGGGRVSGTLWVAYVLPTGHRVRITQGLHAREEDMEISGDDPISEGVLATIPLDDARAILDAMREMVWKGVRPGPISRQRSLS